MSVSTRRGWSPGASEEMLASDQIALRRLGGDWMPVIPSASGLHLVELAQEERVEVRLPALDDATYTGAQVVNGERRALPLGSSLDAEHGVFYWQPAAGFLGNFDLMFTAGGVATKLRMVVGPSMRMAIDTPSNGSMVEQPFTVAGWALDLAAADGAGVDTVHAWAYPAAGGDPVFLAVADIGEARPDVAATYGGQFERSSFSLTVTGLRPGPYDVVVYPYRASSGAFEGAQRVRVIVP